MSQTTIEWTDATWNPVTGCSKVSPGCAHCYAEEVHQRRLSGRHGYPDFKPWTPENAEHNVVLRPDRLDEPLKWRKPRMVFVNSMSDLFHELVPWDFINRVWMTMRNAPQHTYQVLTKRPERLLEWTRIAARAKCWPIDEIWPPWIWLGVSIENYRFVHRADVLREVPMESGGVRFVSAEPLLGSLRPHTLGGLDLSGIEWLIAGGESGPNHRPVDAAWVFELRDAALREGTAFFFKQWGGRTPKAGGRELDGREWNEMPHELKVAA